MKKSHKKFIKKLKKYLKKGPDLRITQALYNVGVTLSNVIEREGKPFYCFIDNYNESDEVILTRMKKYLKNGKKQKTEKREQTEVKPSTGGDIK